MSISVIDFPTIPRYCTALAQWINCMVYVVMFYDQRRYRGGVLAAVCAGFLAALTAELMLTAEVPSLLWSFAMAGAAAIMYLFLRTSLTIRPVQAGYILTLAFLWSEFAASLAWQLYYYYSAYLSGEFEAWPAILITITVYALQFLLARNLDRSHAEGGRAREISARDLRTAAIVTVVFFIVSNLSFIFPETPFTSAYAAEIFNLRTWIDLGGIAVLYALFMQQQELQARYELEAIENVLQTQYTQYLQSRDSMELINRKYHDIKHQIAVIRAESDPERRSQWLDSIEENIAIYDSQYQTGNAVLDTLLTSKTMTCQENGVRMTCVADGTLIGFMDAMDICAIFGNAIDNAVEAAAAAADPDRRLVHLSVSQEKNFLLIRCENYYEGEREFHNGIPRSTKGDDAYHGFGVKSIRHTAQKYGGTLSITAQDNWFDLKVLIPLGPLM